MAKELGAIVALGVANSRMKCLFQEPESASILEVPDICRGLAD
jgi:hypothetical protein